jgi:hypothetical protein
LVAAGGAWFDQFAVLPVQGVLEPKSQQLVSCTISTSGASMQGRLCLARHFASNASCAPCSCKGCARVV